ncbi:MAG TPA: hypothetical protein VF752_05385 [Thermoleophilaceae bacterium]
MEAWGVYGGRLAAAVAAPLALLAFAGCGGGERQDANEPSGDFKVQVVKADFPAKQALAQRSDMVISVKNVDTKTVPNVAVTVKSFEYNIQDSSVADPSRPIFVVNQPPRGGDTAYVDTYALGALKPGQVASFHWSVTAVRPGPFKITYRVAAGLNGKARAVLSEGGAPGGTFTGNVSQKAPQSKVADDGKTVVTTP